MPFGFTRAAGPTGLVDYFAGKSVFITGATGFMGLVLVEKLLRSCPGLKTMYLLMRTKKGLTVEERLAEYVNCEVFDRIQAECPKSILKLRVVPGDVQSDQLGISIADQEELQREVNIIFHLAASVRFDTFIRDAIEINVCGTYKLLKLAETIKNLEVFLHMSTAYCHDELDQLEEKMYPAKHRPEDLMSLVRWMDDDTLCRIEKKLIHPLPNTYSYTKALSEELVGQFAGKLTIAVARPSIVVAAYQEPFPGWINNLNGPTGLLVAGAKGVFRVMHTYKHIRPDVMSVDVAVNASIILAYTTGTEQPKDIRVCNITNSGLNTMTWVETTELFHQYIQKYPYSQCVWYPAVQYHEWRPLYRLHALLVHWLPALLIDTLLVLCRRQPFMINVQKRLHNGLEVLGYYMTGHFVFRNDYFMSMRHILNDKEKEMFFIEYETVDARKYVESCVLGARRYCCKEPPSTIPAAKRLHTTLYYLQLTFKLIFLWWFLNMLYSLVTKIFYS